MKTLSEKIEQIYADCAPCMVGHVGIEFTSITADKLVAKMPVDHRTKQRFGILHGGASAVLAETVASVGAWLNIDEEKFSAVGIEINCSHLKSVSSGFVTATARPLKIGRSIQFWEIKLVNDQNEPTCESRCTLAVIPKR